MTAQAEIDPSRVVTSLNDRVRLVWRNSLVEDTWTGESKTYSRPGGSMFEPLADTSSFGGCGAPKPCGQGTREQIEATPRPNTEAEVLALLLGTRVTADPGIYARLGRHKDVPSGFEIVMRSGVVFARWAAWPLVGKGRTLHPDGHIYSPEFFAGVAGANGMKIDMPMSMYYDYRFHAVMKRGP